MPTSDSKRGALARLVGLLGKRAILLGIVVIIAAIPVIRGLTGAYTKTGGGDAAVIRNGGWLDDNKVRQVIDPASSLTWIGLWSEEHHYPAQQRFYTITSDKGRGDRTGVDVVTVPSSDGVSMGIEGTFYFTLNLDHQSLTDFDNKFGTRQFRGADGVLRYAWDGDLGWSSFLDQILRPVIDNALRTQINDLKCGELSSGCAVLQSQGTTPATGSTANPNISKVQEAITTNLRQDLKNNLGGDFITDIHFTLSGVTLPQTVQQAVDSAQAQRARIAESQAHVQQAQADAQANELRQRGYNACPACAQIDIMKAIPSNVSVYAPGANAAVPLTPTR